MSEVKQADPSSILIPLGEYATEPNEKHTCRWINTQGDFKGELCGRNCGINSDYYCAAHILTAERAERVKEKRLLTPEIPSVRFTTPIEDSYQRVQLAERLDVPKELILTPQEIQHNVEQLKRLDLLNNMMDLLKISFK